MDASLSPGTELCPAPYPVRSLLMRKLLTSGCLVALAAVGGCLGDDAGGEGLSFGPGAELTGARVSATFVDLQPAPPDLGENVWTFRLADLEGGPLPELSVSLAPFMPAHGHGTTPARFPATLLDDESVFSCGPFDLFMPGTWEFTLTIEAEESFTDELIWSLDIEG